MIPMLDYKTIHNRVLRRLDSIKKNKITEEDELFQEDILELERILKRMELRLSKRSYDKNNKIIHYTCKYHRHIIKIHCISHIRKT